MFAGIPDSTPVRLKRFTDALQIAATISTRHRRVADILDEADSPQLVLAGVTVRRLGADGQPVVSGYAQVNLATALFAVADDPVDPRSELRTPRQEEHALISIPPFGIFHHPPAPRRRPPGCAPGALRHVPAGDGRHLRVGSAGDGTSRGRDTDRGRRTWPEAVRSSGESMATCHKPRCKRASRP